MYIAIEYSISCNSIAHYRIAHTIALSYVGFIFRLHLRDILPSHLLSSCLLSLSCHCFLLMLLLFFFSFAFFFVLIVLIHIRRIKLRLLEELSPSIWYYFQLLEQALTKRIGWQSLSTLFLATYLLIITESLQMWLRNGFVGFTEDRDDFRGNQSSWWHSESHFVCRLYSILLYTMSTSVYALLITTSHKSHRHTHRCWAIDLFMVCLPPVFSLSPHIPSEYGGET